MFMKKIYLSISILLMFLGFCSIRLIAQPGTLDTTFGTGGKVTTSQGISEMYGKSVLVQPDGKIIVSGYTYNTNYDFAIVRYNSNGTLDNTFSGDGIVSTDFGNGDEFSFASALQSDGKIIVGGWTDSNGTNCIGIARYNGNGTLDNTFSGDGKAIIMVNYNDAFEEIGDLIVQPDGKIIAICNASYDMMVIRLNNNGSFDKNFNGKGWMKVDFVGEIYGANSIALQSDSKIVAAGYTLVNGVYEIAVVCVKADGTLDNTFSSDGKANITVADSGSFASDLAIQIDGRIVLAGSTIVGDTGFQCAVIRLNTDGTLDNTFSGDGKLNHGILSGDNLLDGLVLQPDGKILATGFASDMDTARFILVRYNSDGTFDTSFNSTGMTTLRFGNSAGVGAAIALQPDNKIVVAGTARNDSNIFVIAVARYFSGLPSSGISEPFVTDTKLYPNPTNNYLHLDYKLSVPGSVSIHITDMQGRTIISVADNKPMDAGQQTETIDLQSLSKGIYNVTIRTKDFEQSYLFVH